MTLHIYYDIIIMSIAIQMLVWDSVFYYCEIFQTLNLFKYISNCIWYPARLLRSKSSFHWQTPIYFKLVYDSFKSAILISGPSGSSPSSSLHRFLPSTVQQKWSQKSSDNSIRVFISEERKIYSSQQTDLLAAIRAGGIGRWRRYIDATNSAIPPWLGQRHSVLN